MAATGSIAPPDLSAIVMPILSALPGAAISTEPASTILPLLSPILRQRVQLFACQDPWIRHLTYDTAKAPQLAQIAQSGTLEPHPVSGEIEIDWDNEVWAQYRRLDDETLQCLVVLSEVDLTVQLVYCVGDSEGGGDGWRVGEVGVGVSHSPFGSFKGCSSVEEAERAFKTSASVDERQPNGTAQTAASQAKASQTKYGHGDEDKGNDNHDDIDDDDYWARYDATPARTPAVKRSPAPGAHSAVPSSTQTNTATDNSTHRSDPAEDDYYAQYDSVQPAMDNHDPDEEVANAEHSEPAPPLGLARPMPPQHLAGDSLVELHETSGAWTLADPRSPSARSREEEERTEALVHPRPASSASSNGSRTVARLEETAAKRQQSEFGVKQHISRSIRSLFLLSRASGIDRDEFERMIKTELDVLGIIEDEI